MHPDCSDHVVKTADIHIFAYNIYSKSLSYIHSMLFIFGSGILLVIFSRRVDWIEESVRFCLRVDVIARAFGSPLPSHTCLCFIPKFMSLSLCLRPRCLFGCANTSLYNMFKRAVFALQMDIPQYDIEYAGLLDEKNQDLFDNDTPASGLDDSDGDDAEIVKEVMVKAQTQISGPSGFARSRW